MEQFRSEATATVQLTFSQAAQDNTRLLNRLMPKGVGFPLRSFSVLCSPFLGCSASGHGYKEPGRCGCCCCPSFWWWNAAAAEPGYLEHAALLSSACLSAVPAPHSAWRSSFNNWSQTGADWSQTRELVNWSLVGWC